MIHINEWARKVRVGEKRMVIPIMTHPGIELCGRRVVEAVKDGQLHAEAILRLDSEYPSDGVTAIMDLTVEAEAFGATVEFTDDEIPNVTGRLVHDEQTVQALQVPSLNAGRIPKYLEANRLVVERISGKPVFGGCAGPFSLAGRLFGLSEMMMALYMSPAMIQELLEKCTAFILDYCAAMKWLGLDGVIMAEPAAGLVSNADCITYSSVYVKRIVERLQDDDFMIVLHNCGNSGHCTDAMVKSGAAALHFGNKINMIEALKQVPEDILVMGNVDPVNTFKFLSEQQMYDTVLALLCDTAGWRNYILSTGCDVPPHVSHKNIEAFYRAVHDFNLSK